MRPRRDREERRKEIEKSGHKYFSIIFLKNSETKSIFSHLSRLGRNPGKSAENLHKEALKLKSKEEMKSASLHHRLKVLSNLKLKKFDFSIVLIWSFWKA